MSKIHSIDFEYRKKDEEFLDLVCVSLDDKVYWLKDSLERANFTKAMGEYQGEYFIAHSASFAEIPCCIKLGLDVDKYVWIDTESLFMFIQHFKNGTDGAKGSNGKVQVGLLDCLDYYKIPHISKEQKEAFRDIILNQDIEENKEQIISYCKSDTDDLELLFDSEIMELFDLLYNENTQGRNYINPQVDEWKETPCCPFIRNKFNLYEFILSESLTHISVAKMYCVPFDLDPYLVNHIQTQTFKVKIMNKINEIIPDYFSWEGKEQKGVFLDWVFNKDKKFRDWWEKGVQGDVETKTKTGAYSTADKVIEQFLDDFRNTVPELEEFRQFKKLLNACRGLSNIDTKKNWIKPNHYSDGYRCHTNEQGAATSRFGNKASACHVPSWSKALRSCLKPQDKNIVYFSCDFNAQEMWIIGQMSKDYNLLEVYESSDVYMSMAQQMNLYPKDLPIPTEKQRSEEWFKPYKKIRSSIKGVNLGMNYGMAPKTYATRNNIDEEEAKRYWELFEETFDNKTRYIENIRDLFVTRSNLCIGKEQLLCRPLPHMRQDKKERISQNLPIQGMGAQITRRAIRYCQEQGLQPFLPVHDEIYFKTTTDKLKQDIIVARKMMKKAAFDCLEFADKDFPIKVGEAELYTSDKYTIHEGAEKVFNEIMKICREIDDGDCDLQIKSKFNNKLDEFFE